MYISKRVSILIEVVLPTLPMLNLPFNLCHREICSHPLDIHHVHGRYTLISLNICAFRTSWKTTAQVISVMPWTRWRVCWIPQSRYMNLWRCLVKMSHSLLKMARRSLKRVTSQGNSPNSWARVSQPVIFYLTIHLVCSEYCIHVHVCSVSGILCLPL